MSKTQSRAQAAKKRSWRAKRARMSNTRLLRRVEAVIDRAEENPDVEPHSTPSSPVDERMPDDARDAPGNRTRKCGLQTLFRQTCRAFVPRTAHQLTFGNTGDSSAHFCKRHQRRLLPHASGFYSNLKWVKFDDYVTDDLRLQTQIALRKLMMKPLSSSDEPGYVYALEVRDESAPADTYHIKVGRTTILNRRIQHWKNKCKSKKMIVKGWWPNGLRRHNRVQLAALDDPGEKGPWCHRLEELIRVELTDRALHQPHYSTEEDEREDRLRKHLQAELSHMRGPCVDCKVEHQEIFSFARPEGGEYVKKEWRKLVKPVIQRWGMFVNECLTD